jgi:beta-glucosidase
VKTVAVIGPTADLMSSLLGNYAGTPSHPSTLLKGLRDALEPKGITVLSAPGAPVAKGFQESGNPIPTDVLFTDETRATAGLVGQVFTNLELKGAALAKRTDGPVDLRWNPQEPQPNIPTENVAIRWTGILVPTQAGSTVLGMTLTGSGKLFIDDKMVIDAWKPGNFRCVSTAIVLEAGKPYRVRLDYAQTSGGAQIQLGWKQPNDHGILNTALAIARKADHIVLTLGLTPDIEGEQMNVHAEGFASGDRTSVLLPSSQRELLDAISALGKPITVVLTTGSAISLDTTKANAILVAWYYGQRGGDALAEALCGTMNPSGRLPVTFYQNDADLPDFSDYSMANRTYRYFTGKPLFAFGYGLSYTTFTYAGAKLSATSAKATDGVTVQVEVKNTGKRRGDEVVQVYAHAVAPPVAMPIQSLVGFARVSLEPGESKKVEIPVKAASLRRWNEATRSYIVDPGAYTLRIGPSSDNVVATTTLTIIL